MSVRDVRESGRRELFRDQRRAIHAYRVVGELAKGQAARDYKIAVNDFGANILRSGLCAAVAALERHGERGRTLLGHLASAGIPGLENVGRDAVGRRVCELPLDEYVLATREALQVAAWLKRAVQAIVED